MTTFIAYANIQQPFPFDEIPRELVPENLHMELQGNSRITQRHQCRRLAHFLLWQLLKKAGKSTALLGQIYRTQSGRPQFLVENIDFNNAGGKYYYCCFGYGFNCSFLGSGCAV